MSQLFDNYHTSDKYNLNPLAQVPDNTRQKLEMKPLYDEVIVLGADNTHCFQIPHRKEEISKIKIIYNQGIETKLIKEYEVVYGENNDIIEENGAIHWDYPNPNAEYPEDRESSPDRWYSLISCDVTAEETNNFNWYNQDVNVQIFTTLRNGKFVQDEGTKELTALELMMVYDGELTYSDHFVPDDPMTFNFDASKIYTVKIVRKLEERIENNSEEGEIDNG